MQGNGPNRTRSRHPVDMRDSSKRLQHILGSAKKYTIRNEDFSNLESVRKLRAMCLRKQQRTALSIPRYSVAVSLGIVSIIMVLLVYCTRLHTTYSCKSNSSHEASVHTVRPRYLLDGEDVTQLCSAVDGADDVDDPSPVDYPIMSSSRLWLHRKR